MVASAVLLAAGAAAMEPGRNDQEQYPMAQITPTTDDSRNGAWP